VAMCCSSLRRVRDQAALACEPITTGRPELSHALVPPATEWASKPTWRR
jgi:hypothetical protein